MISQDLLVKTADMRTVLRSTDGIARSNGRSQLLRKAVKKKAVKAAIGERMPAS